MDSSRSKSYFKPTRSLTITDTVSILWWYKNEYHSTMLFQNSESKEEAEDTQMMTVQHHVTKNFLNDM